MIKNYFLIAWRNLQKSKGYSAINIGGLAVGMAVAILIGLWIWDEINFNKHHKNYDSIVRVMQHQTFNGTVQSFNSNPYIMASEIRKNHGEDFLYVVQSSWNNEHILTFGDKALIRQGSYIEPEISEMLSLEMIHGAKDGLKDMNSMLLNESVAKAFFGDENPIGKTLKINNKVELQVKGVYRDIPENSSFHDLEIIMPWEQYLAQNTWATSMSDPWGANFTQVYAQLSPDRTAEEVSTRIKDLKINQISDEEKKYNPQIFVHPMNKWHLYNTFENGINTGGQIETVWMFGIIAVFVLLLACINFMNLSTARSEKRAKEVGIRKSIGSNKFQLMAQFFSESILISLIAMLFSIILVTLMLPSFNGIAEKSTSIPWTSPVFWTLTLGFSLFTGFVAGLYPALFLSSFQPVDVLKSTYRAGKAGSLPRKILVISQFSIAITLIIGTTIVYQQVNYAQNRPIGYDKSGLINLWSNEMRHKNFDVIRQSLIDANAIVDMTECISPATDVYNTNGGFDWEGKDPSLGVDFPNNGVTFEYGKTIGWTVKEGRDFSRAFISDSSALILNQAAAEFMGFDDPIGKTVKWNGEPYTVIGVVDNLLVESPYLPVRASIFHISGEEENVLILRLNPQKSTSEALAKVEEVFRRFDPATPFKTDFVDQSFAEKFRSETRIGYLAGFFGFLAIFLSCLGLFGLASYVAEQRTKEIGVRKVLGASVASVWKLLSSQFIVLVIISCIVSIPIAYYLMNNWLNQFDYRTDISFWVFVVASLGAILLTLITVSFQAIKAAVANPVKSLRTE
ncbi:MAG TPA: ABC transporter permease [Saprospiraceae bacterium]|nr:ABC transporter permease [Saprospiraceae bacterium]